MTTRQLLGLVLRRWYLLLAGALLSVGALWVVTQQQPVYFTQFNIVLLPPEQADVPNHFEDGPYQLSQFAGVVAADVSAERAPLTASSDTTLFGMGTASGVQVRVPNQGNQWRPRYISPYLDVQVVDSSAAGVQQRADQVVQDVADALRVRQEELGLPRSAWVTSLPSSEDPVIYPVAGSRPRAVLGVAAVGVSLTVALIYWLELLRTRRRRSQAVSDGADSSVGTSQQVRGSVNE